MKHGSEAQKTVVPLIVLAALCMPGCDDSDRTFTTHPISVDGNGFVTERTIPIGGFTRIAMQGVGTLYIDQGAQPELVVRAEENLQPYLDAEVRSGELVIWKDSPTLFNTRPIEFHLTVVDLERVTLTGAADVEASNIDTAALTLSQTGVGDIRFTGLNASSVEVETSGLGEVTLAGSAYSQDVRLRNMTSYDGRDLASVEADVLITNAGSATVRVSDRLQATINGSGFVYYIGDPIVIRQGHGSGGVVQIVN